ncbi:hypothetical protein KAR91_49460 [Candidatus Pacearchaeota archaeon]|nr:hypothetical protein [Candidatus Pacearchaeota archaeon]
MKGYFFEFNYKKWEIISEPLVMLDGFISIIAKGCDDHKCDVFDIGSIVTIYPEITLAGTSKA